MAPVLPVPTGGLLEDPSTGLRKIVDNEELWVGWLLAFSVAVPLMFVGLGAISRSFVTEPARSWGRLAVVAAAIGTTVFIGMAAISFAKMGLAEAWSDAIPQEQVAAARIAQAGDIAALALFGFWLIVFFGVAIVLYGVTVTSSNLYPRWLGWAAIVLGVGSVAAGMVKLLEAAFAAPAADAPNALFAFILAGQVWMVVMGVLLWRRVDQVAGAETST